MSAPLPDLTVALSSSNPWAWVAAIRLALRRAGRPQTEIEEFSDEALEDPRPDAVRKVCERWARVEHA